MLNSAPTPYSPMAEVLETLADDVPARATGGDDVPGRGATGETDREREAES